MSEELLLRIARCTVANAILRDGKSAHPCADVVRWQPMNGIAPQRVPEPWNGRLTSAPLLFVASNPGISGNEVYPDAGWSDDQLIQFFQDRFGEDVRSPISAGGRRVLNVDGTRDRANPFLASIRQRALELGLSRPGIDYAVTEVVHCKTPGERHGVGGARAECVDRYFGEVLTASRACMIVLLGQHASWAAQRILGTDQNSMMQLVNFRGRDILTLALSHPNARGVKKSLAANVGDMGLQELKAWLRRHQRSAPT